MVVTASWELNVNVKLAVGHNRTPYRQDGFGHVYQCTPEEAEAGVLLQISGQPGLHDKTVSRQRSREVEEETARRSSFYREMAQLFLPE